MVDGKNIERTMLMYKNGLFFPKKTLDTSMSYHTRSVAQQFIMQKLTLQCILFHKTFIMHK